VKFLLCPSFLCIFYFTFIFSPGLLSGEVSSMPTSKSSRNGQSESHRRGRSSSFHGQAAGSVAPLRRPKTVPDLLSLRSHPGSPPDCPPRQPPKMLLKVAVLRSLSPVQVLMTPDSTVGDLIAAALRQYVKESRRPILPANTASDFDLHYSQFSLESRSRQSHTEKITCNFSK